MANLAMSSTNGEEPPVKKKPSTEPKSFSSLPEDVIVICLARVSRFHYPILSLVSKSFRSLLASPALHRTRTLLNRTESCLYVCLQYPTEPDPRWFILVKKPEQNLTKKTKERSSSLDPVRTLNSPTVEWSYLIAVGSYLYAIKEIGDTAPCYNIPFLDCQTHTWFEAPSMRIAHSGSEYFDGLSYLPESFENPDSSSLNCIEVFNTETQTWNWYHPLASEKRKFKPREMEGKILKNISVRSAKMGMTYNPKETTYERLGLSRLCVIEDISYWYDSSKGFQWSSLESVKLRPLKGLQRLPKFAHYSNVTLASYGAKMMVFWDKVMPKKGGYEDKMIWCAEISFEKRNNGEEIWGKVEWFDAVHKVPKSYKFVYTIAATF